MTQQEKDIIKGLAKRYSIYGLEFRISGNACVDIVPGVFTGNRVQIVNLSNQSMDNFVFVMIMQRIIILLL